ncbi:NADH-quinone oxidoreductase subunit L [Acidisphaera sp. L21]|uniref:NADH-quinone oxidoreductase subunit L n=1 Tax=Acidisphaera sp. L21 TaxID=1641851 RepID=UPI00131B7CBB|nr:NADH-quinone oxidoreductase subunit L [Acidisphaera sp. L21]
MIYAIAILSPLAGCLLAGIFGRRFGDTYAKIVTIGFMILAALCAEISLSQVLFAEQPPEPVILATWFDIGGFRLDWALRRDTLSSAMVAMVAPVATLIHIYSVGYMAHERRSFRFFAYLSLFTFAMLMLVTANNLVQLFFGWEGVGLASYLLIGYWYDRPSANRAAMKAFIVNRVGDLFFALGIALVFQLFGSVEFPVIFAHIPDHQDALYHVLGHTWRAYEVIGFLLFIGAMGKSAQLGLHTWLPDAMEGPTPVSALIHAATMVTAGVFLMARMSYIMESAPGALTFVMLIGASTCIFAATIACVQNDIKRVIAYSTCSQLGYMFMAAGAGAYQASVFHLITHAFFKALLFLCAGSVIHAMSDEQDMRKMGGIWRMVPWTYTCMWLGSLAIAGIPFFAGYWSKDAILEATWASHNPLAGYGYLMGVLAAFLTAFYSWRLIIMTFHGTPRADKHTMEHVHESTPWMVAPLVILAFGAVFAGWLLHGWFIGEDQAEFWAGAIHVGANNHVLHDMENIPSIIGLLPTITGVLGIALAYVMYMLVPSLPGRLASTFQPIYQFLLHKWYFDELYDFLFVRPIQRLARVLWHVGDEKLIDGMPNSAAALAAGGSAQVVKIQTGSIAVYAFTMLIGLVVLISIFLLFR